jgi:Glycosyl transferases group 1/Glycosyltransferase Family 4
MRVLVFVNPLEMGGSAINAIDLAAAARDRHGHQVALFAVPGPAAALAAQRGIELIAAPVLSRPFPRPSFGMMRALDAAMRRTRADLVHVWEMPQIYDGYYGAHVMRGLPILATNMTMGHMRTIPPEIPLTAGTQEIVDAARARRPGPVWLLEPSVDALADDPEQVDPAPFVAEHRLREDDAPLVVVVSRITATMKLEGIRQAVRAVELLDSRRRVRLAVVGAGDALDEVRRDAEGVNARLSRRAVVVTGGLDDPRSAYAAADVLLGMGSSALRGLAFGKPTVILGERGFSEVFDESTRDRFLHRGPYGVGPGVLTPESARRFTQRLAEQIERLVRSPESALSGTRARSLIVDRYAVRAVAARLDRIYHEAAQPVAWRSAVVHGVRHAPTTILTQLPYRIRKNPRLRSYGKRVGFLEGASASTDRAEP